MNKNDLCIIFDVMSLKVFIMLTKSSKDEKPQV
jgi:hypothetical protein